MLTNYHEKNSDFSKKADYEYNYIIESINDIWKLSKLDFEQLNEITNNLPSEKLNEEEELELGDLLNDIELRISKHAKETLKNKSCINKFLSTLEHHVNSNTGKRGQEANEINALDSKRIDFKKSLFELNNKNGDALASLETLLEEIRSQTGIKHNGYLKTEKMVKVNNTLI